MRQALDGSRLESLLEKRKMATLEELKATLGTSSTMSVFRKLKPLGYQTSYSHRGKYYTLMRTPRLDERGLWEQDAVWFSRYGNLLATSQHWVETAATGVTTVELGEALHVEVKEPLLALPDRDPGPSLPPWRFPVESDRTSPILRDLQKLGDRE